MPASVPTKTGPATCSACRREKYLVVKRRYQQTLIAAEWKVIVRAAKGRCYYCQEKTKLTLDHVIPLSKGGQHTKTNVVPACQPCNSKKNDRLILLV
ncbi:MAG TPA: HNH endonuclease [Steroidobacteraceae bacterium]